MTRLIAVFLILVTTTFAACTSYEKVLSSKDVDYKLTKANEYYDKGRYFEASRVYENLVPVLRGTKNYEELYYRMAYSFYKDKDYLNAAYQFKNFTEFFPRSNRAEEMQFMYAVATFKDSRKFSLDQTETEKAIAALQNYISIYPSSKYTEEATQYLNSAYNKLEYKDAKAALQYFNMDDYKSASVAYKTLIYDYPSSKNMDYYYFMVLKVMQKYAKHSKPASQMERFQEAASYFDLLKSYFPNSQYMAEATKYNTIVQNKIKELTK